MLAGNRNIAEKRLINKERDTETWADQLNHFCGVLSDRFRESETSTPHAEHPCKQLDRGVFFIFVNAPMISGLQISKTETVIN